MDDSASSTQSGDASSCQMRIVAPAKMIKNARSHSRRRGLFAFQIGWLSRAETRLENVTIAFVESREALIQRTRPDWRVPSKREEYAACGKRRSTCHCRVVTES